MEKRVHDVETNFDAFLAAIESAKEANSTEINNKSLSKPPENTQKNRPPPVPPKWPLDCIDPPPPRRPSYHTIPSPNPKIPRSQSLFRTDRFALAVKQPKSLKLGKLPMYDRHGTDKFRTYCQKLEQHVAHYSEYYEGPGFDEMIIIVGQTLSDNVAS